MSKVCDETVSTLGHRNTPSTSLACIRSAFGQSSQASFHSCSLRSVPFFHLGESTACGLDMVYRASVNGECVNMFLGCCTFREFWNDLNAFSGAYMLF